jgi:hypothetical protein
LTDLAKGEPAVVVGYEQIDKGTIHFAPALSHISAHSGIAILSKWEIIKARK